MTRKTPAGVRFQRLDDELKSLRASRNIEGIVLAGGLRFVAAETKVSLPEEELFSPAKIDFTKDEVRQLRDWQEKLLGSESRLPATGPSLWAGIVADNEKAIRAFLASITDPADVPRPPLVALDVALGAGKRAGFEVFFGDGNADLETALKRSAAEGYSHVMKALIDAGARVDALPEKQFQRLVNSFTVEQLANSVTKGEALQSTKLATDELNRRQAERMAAPALDADAPQRQRNRIGGGQI